MKRLFLLLTLLLTLGGALRAQVDTAGQPDATDSVAAGYEEIVYQAPNVNPIYLFGNPFCDHFAELSFLLGIEDQGIGLTYAYLPEVWGGHATAYLGYETLWLMGGADYRMSKPWSKGDVHLCGSAGVCCMGRSFGQMRPAVGLSLRVSRPEDRGRLSLVSANVGVVTNFDTYYLTLGFSLSLTVLASAFLLLIV